MRIPLISAILLLLAMATAHAQGPVFDTISAGNLAINVKGSPYNANCDGTTDDTAAIQGAINAGVASGNPFTLLLPAGVCKTTAPLIITPTAGSGQNIAVKGESRATSQLLVTGTGDGIDFTMSKSASTIFSAQLDVSDLTILASASAGTALKLTSDAPNSVSPKFRNLRIGYLGSGSFANGISIAHMSNIMVHQVNINSPNATGIAFQFDGDSTFPSITDNFSDVYFWGFQTGIQIGNGTTSYVQGIEIVNAQLQQNTQHCVVWYNQPAGYLGDQFLMSNSFCNGTIDIKNVQNIVLQGNYILSGPGRSQVSITTATSGVIANNVFNGTNAANTNGLVITGSHTIVIGNNFLNYSGASSAPIVFGSGSTDSVAIGNKCDACATDPVVNDFGTNWQVANISPGFLAGTQDNIPSSRLFPQATVATLPPCNAARKGTMSAVSDATSPAYNVAATGGGTVPVPVFCNGTAWLAH